MYHNPIIPGFNPDPSICHAQGRYYLAVSTFEFFPGVTVYESGDLVNWSYCSSVLTRESQLPLSSCRDSSGIYAPTLRFHEGMFFLVTTNKAIPMNFIVTSHDIHGPWSEPFPVSPMGIDPSLFFDDDGSCMYVSNGTVNGVKGIYGHFINPYDGKPKSEVTLLSVCTNDVTEAPHLYKRGGWYYLMVAEGGTEYGHHEMIFRSRTILGPYAPDPHNPILSHVKRIEPQVVYGTGHADLIAVDDEHWYAVFLAFRQPSRTHLHHLGRETFLAPVTWDDEGWPVIGEEGRVRLDYEDLFLPQQTQNPSLLRIGFSENLSRYPLEKVRIPKDACYVQDREQGTMKLIGDGDRMNPTLLLLRQPAFSCTFTAILRSVSLQGNAGITAWYNTDYFLKLNVTDNGSSFIVSLVRQVHDFQAVTETMTIPRNDCLTLSIIAEPEWYTFVADGKELGRSSTATLSTEGTMHMSFTGVLFGIYADTGEAVFKEGMSIR